MTSLMLIAVDLAAVVVLAYALYFRRHRRRDLVTAFVVVNIGVLAVTKVLASAEIGMGVGLGLFGVLSIIRLRSSEISQHEVAYYFASLAIGLIAGFDTLQPLLSVSLIALILAMIAIVDSPLLLSRSRQQSLRLDRAFTDESAMRAHVEQLLGGTVKVMEVTELDMVNDTTTVDVRWHRPDHSTRVYAPQAEDQGNYAQFQTAIRNQERQEARSSR
ncbi:DUF4956 domain-containing protein [Nesterenkonia lutea]|uniref:DUF4956 domain-containing protein n=1 Tax=Nesterenkonia lutea TaxID=272919 RepID=A0ABR9JDG2_9MICC|nr:DUF4956 domain-containing protein [Nesterenkonia lutea]MBE1523971.1 hypothetical protein [Nesterenkonia lutea]